MQKYEGFKKAGSFRLVTGTEVRGELCLKGAATTLDLYSAEFFDPRASSDISGVFYDRSKVSLVNCVTMSEHGFGPRGDEGYHFASVFPHVVIFGDRHINSSDRIIRELSFSVDDASSLFYDCDAFGSVFNARPHMEHITQTDERGKRTEIGDHPLLFYFTGKYGIFDVDTVLGKISATHDISYRLPGPEGMHVDNTIRLSMAFDSGRTVDEAIAGMLDILRFLEVIAGRPQNISELLFLPVSDDEHSRALDVYWCMPSCRDRDDGSRRPHPADLPIQAGTRPDEFTNVLRLWLEREEAWRNARTRFSTVFACQRRYDVERIIGAANMFDILPSSGVVVLPADLERARDNARKEFESLPPSPERDSVLGALGRIGKLTLKRKIRSRANLITDIVGDRFPELDMVVDQAVDCRNYYVHGSTTKIDYGAHCDQVPFLTDTLEFVFAASDLIEAGWDIATWIKQGCTGSHPFGRYHVNYAQRLGALKRLLRG